jgi:hypothetical protein
VTSVLIGASSVKQLEDNVAALKNREFTATELTQIELILTGRKFNIPTTANNSHSTVKNEEASTSSRGDFIKNLGRKLSSQ